MGKVLIINKVYKIKEGVFSGYTGKLVAYDAEKNEAVLRVDKNTKVVTVSEDLEPLEGRRKC